MAKYIVVHSVKVATDFVPETFGRLTTIGPRFRMKNRVWQVMRCDCGTISVERTDKTKKDCGCVSSQQKTLKMRNTNDAKLYSTQNTKIIGMRFGLLTPQSPPIWVVDPDGGRVVGYLCICECGNSIRVRKKAIVTGNTKSCGCLAKAKTIARNTVHGLCRDANYSIWSCMLDRCNNPRNKHYSDYGGRGIQVCGRWTPSQDKRAFVNFLEDMGSRPSSGYSLDRIDNDGPYAPDNCRWATRTQQNRNKRSNHIVTIIGESKTLAEWEEDTGVASSTIRARIRLGMQGLDIIKVGKHKGGPKKC